jgi:hypothetical protein
MQDVHIVLEDRISNPGIPFCVGVTLESIKVDRTSDSQWKMEPGETINKDKATTHKIILMEQLSVYCNSNLYSFNNGYNLSDNAKHCSIDGKYIYLSFSLFNFKFQYCYIRSFHIKYE